MVHVVRMFCVVGKTFTYTESGAVGFCVVWEKSVSISIPAADFTAAPPMTTRYPV